MRPPDPDLHPQPIPKLLAIDWSAIKLTSDADALALWARIAPTGHDWDQKLDELPREVERPLAIALLRGGGFTCTPPRAAADCVPPVFDVAAPAPTAGLADPCLRRLLALWSIEQLDPDDLVMVMDGLRAIAAIPPPESELTTAAIRVLPDDEHAARLELLATAWRAGQHDVVNQLVGKLDEPHLIEAAGKHHIDGALEVLSAQAHRAAYLAAIGDEAMAAKARSAAIGELAGLDDKLPADVQAALVRAAGSKDCAVAATAARTLAGRGDRRFVPSAANTRARTADKLMRALCVLASYEQLQRADEPSLLPGFVPAKGLERVTVVYDALGEVDRDGDGDPHTERTVELIPREDAALPEIEDLARAMRRCTGATCRSDDREFRFAFKPAGELQLARLEIIERPPCPRQ